MYRKNNNTNIISKIYTLFSGINRSTFNTKAIKNRARLITSYSFKRYHLANLFPSLVHIELTNICQLHCVMCPISVMKREKGYMNIGLFKKIIDELSLSPVETVALSFFGESLLHKQFPDFLRIAKSAGLNVFLSTNGLNLSYEIAHAIIENSMDMLIVSYDSSKSDTYKNIRRGGDIDKLNNNLERFLRMKGRKPPLVVLQCIEFSNIMTNIEKVKDYWQKYDVIVAARPAHDWLGNISDITQVSLENKKGKDYGICDQPWRHAVIYWDGCVGPCCNFYDKQVVLGNLNNATLLEIWNGKKAEDFREKHILFERGQIKECATCKQQSPNFLEKATLFFFDMGSINRYISITDGWRN